MLLNRPLHFFGGLGNLLGFASLWRLDDVSNLLLSLLLAELGNFGDLASEV